MYLDSREGTLYGQKLVSGKSFKNAFIEAAQYYQTQRESGDSVARVIGYTAAQNDTITTYHTYLSSENWYINNPSIQYDCKCCDSP